MLNEFSKICLTFLEHVIDAHGVSPDPSKTAAINNMDIATLVSRRFLGDNQSAGKILQNIAELSQPLRELMGAKSAWSWSLSESQEDAFGKLKHEVTSQSTLALYDPAAETMHSICRCIITRPRSCFAAENSGTVTSSCLCSYCILWLKQLNIYKLRNGPL